MSQFDKDDVEKVGLVKFDFLGLTDVHHPRLDRALYPAARCGQGGQRTERSGLNRFRSRTSRSMIRHTYALMRQGNTVGVFQFESRGMKDLLQKAKPDRFEDIIALVALYRPGPMSLIPEFIERKHGKRVVEYLDPRLTTDTRAYLRHHGLPGAGDADRAGDRRIQPWRAPICCAARWARKSPRKWLCTAISSCPAQ